MEKDAEKTPDNRQIKFDNRQDAEKEKWIKCLDDFAYAQDGEMGDCSIEAIDVYKKIASALSQARSEGYEKGKVEGMAFWWKAKDQGWNEAIAACVTAVKGLMNCWDKAQTEMHHTKHCAGLDIAEKLSALVKK